MSDGQEVFCKSDSEADCPTADAYSTSTDYAADRNSPLGQVRQSSAGCQPLSDQSNRHTLTTSALERLSLVVLALSPWSFSLVILALAFLKYRLLAGASLPLFLMACGLRSLRAEETASAPVAWRQRLHSKCYRLTCRFAGITVKTYLDP